MPEFKNRKAMRLKKFKEQQRFDRLAIAAENKSYGKLTMLGVWVPSTHVAFIVTPVLSSINNQNGYNEVDKLFYETFLTYWLLLKEGLFLMFILRKK